MIDTRAFVKSLNNKPVAVYGLGLSGFSTAKALIASGASVYAWDEDEEKRFYAAQAGIEISSFEHDDLADFSILVLSPGIPLHFPEPHAIVQKARDAGLEIICDIEILHRCGHDIKTVGITGTNGKSTTTALIHHILNEQRIPNAMGGNIGKPILDIALSGKQDVLVIELSSYQLDLCPTFTPDISVLLNITPDHLDRHGDMDGYVAAKERIFKWQGIAICGVDDVPSKAVCERTKVKSERIVYPVSVKEKLESGVYVENGTLHDVLKQGHESSMPVGGFTTLQGVHNHQNIGAAYAACRCLDIGQDDILSAMKTFPGLAHRQYLTRIINGIAYINDSKATNMDAAAKAIACYKNIYLIAGGRPKTGGLSGIEDYAQNIAHVFLIGEAMDDFAKHLQSVGIPHSKSGSLDVAVLDAHNLAQSKRGEPGGAPTILLSPACASWDQFRSFEDRGNVFMDLVKSLSEDV